MFDKEHFAKDTPCVWSRRKGTKREQNEGHLRAGSGCPPIIWSCHASRGWEWARLEKRTEKSREPERKSPGLEDPARVSCRLSQHWLILRTWWFLAWCCLCRNGTANYSCWDTGQDVWHFWTIYLSHAGQSVLGRRQEGEWGWAKRR